MNDIPPMVTDPAAMPEKLRAPAPHFARLEPKDHVETQGEKKFNFRTYNLLGYMVNALMSVAAVYWVERTHSGRAGMDKYGGKVAQWLHLDPEPAKMIARKSFFLSGGFAVLLPIKWMENAKVKLVEKWDRQIYGEKVDTDPTIRQSHRELEAAPKQSWSSIIASRIMALIPFYITVGLLWDRGSMLSRVTNPALRGKSKTEIAALEQSLGATRFNQVASRGIYFDRPIAWAARQLGKCGAWLRGDTQAVTDIAAMEAHYPGMVKHTHNSTHDSNYSVVPYYFISEAITSAMVAWGVFALTRITGPFFAKKPDAETMPAQSPGAANTPPQPTPPHAAQTTAPEADLSTTPTTQIHTIHHTPPAAQPLLAQHA